MVLLFRSLGRILGVSFGYMIHEVIGSLIGFVVGYFFDQGLSQNLRKIQFVNSAAGECFFDTTFSLLGHLAKKDGQVTTREIELARYYMERLDLDQEQVKRAMQAFNLGKSPNFQVADQLREFRSWFFSRLVDEANFDGDVI